MDVRATADEASSRRQAAGMVGLRFHKPPLRACCPPPAHSSYVKPAAAQRGQENNQSAWRLGRPGALQCALQHTPHAAPT